MAVVRYCYGANPDKPDDRDHRRTYQQHQIPTWTHPNVDLSGYIHQVYDQGELESCTANALCAAYELDLVKRSRTTKGGFSYFNPSRLFLYYNTREHEGTQSEDVGASIRDAVKAMNCRGVCKESDWPYMMKFNEKPPESAYAAAKGNDLCKYERLDHNIDQFRACLKDNCPFIFGFKVYDSFLDSKNGYMPMPSTYERDHGSFGRHAVLAVGYDDSKRRIKVLNSWGSKWGDNGYFYMPYEFIEDSSLCFDFWKISFACEQGKPRPKDTVPCPLSFMDRASGYDSSGYFSSSRVCSKVSGHESSLRLPPIHVGGASGYGGYPTQSRVNRRVRHYDWFDHLLSSRSGGAFGYPSQSRINRISDSYDPLGLRRNFGPSDDDEHSCKRYSSNKYRGWY